MEPITLFLFFIYKFFLFGELIGGIVVLIFLDLPLMEFGIYLLEAVVPFFLTVVYIYFPLIIFVKNTHVKKRRMEIMDCRKPRLYH